MKNQDRGFSKARVLMVLVQCWERLLRDHSTITENWDMIIALRTASFGNGN